MSSQVKETEDMQDSIVADLTYEQAFTQLEELVESLETNQQSLEGLLILFEKGQLLVQHCARLLDQAELKIQQISGDETIDFSA